MGNPFRPTSASNPNNPLNPKPQGNPFRTRVAPTPKVTDTAGYPSKAFSPLKIGAPSFQQFADAGAELPAAVTPLPKKKYDTAFAEDILQRRAKAQPAQPQTSYATSDIVGRLARTTKAEANRPVEQFQQQVLDVLKAPLYAARQAVPAVSGMAAPFVEGAYNLLGRPDIAEFTRKTQQDIEQSFAPQSAGEEVIGGGMRIAGALAPYMAAGSLRAPIAASAALTGIQSKAKGGSFVEFLGNYLDSDVINRIAASKYKVPADMVLDATLGLTFGSLDNTVNAFKAPGKARAALRAQGAEPFVQMSSLIREGIQSGALDAKAANPYLKAADKFAQQAKVRASLPLSGAGARAVDVVAGLGSSATQFGKNVASNVSNEAKLLGSVGSKLAEEATLRGARVSVPREAMEGDFNSSLRRAVESGDDAEIERLLTTQDEMLSKAQERIDYRVKGADDPVANQFIAMRNKSTRPGFLSPLAPEELVDKRVTLKHNGTVGFALTPDGDMQNLFNNGGPKGAAREVVFDGIRSGGKTLDAFSGYLTDLYRQYGFVETGRLKFNDEFAPAGWDVDVDGRPDVVFMAYRGGEPEDVVRARVFNPNLWIPEGPPSQYFDDYDAAANANKSAASTFQQSRTTGQNIGADAGTPLDAAGAVVRTAGSGGVGRALGAVGSVLPRTPAGQNIGSAALGAAFGATADKEDRLRGAGAGALVGLAASRGGGIGLSTRVVDDAVEAPFKAFSAGLRAIGNAAQDRGDAGYWLGVLAKGTRKAEIDDTRIGEWLAQQKGTITRANVSAALRERLPVLGSADRGYKVPTPTDQAPLPRDSYSTYAIPGAKTNYSELVTTAKPVQEGEVFVLRDGVTSDVISRHSTRGEAEAAALAAQAEGRQVYGQSIAAPDADVYRHSHWSGVDNPIVHTRVDERVVNGERVLVINESQSDVHQEGRKKGYKTPEAKKAYAQGEVLLDELRNQGNEARRVAEREKNRVVSEILSTDPTYRNLLRQGTELETVKYRRVNELLDKLPPETSSEARIEARKAATNTFKETPEGVTLEEQIDFAREGRMDRMDEIGRSVKAMPNIKALYEEEFRIAQEIRALRQRPNPQYAVPDLPFKKTPQWTELNLKRILEEAVKRGAERVVLPLGKQAADMFSLRTVADRLDWNVDPDGSTGSLTVYRNGQEVRREVFIAPEELPGMVGADVSARLIADGRLEGDALDVGAQGMTGYYEGIVPKTVKDYGKKLGVKIEVEKVGQGDNGGISQSEYDEAVSLGLARMAAITDERVAARNAIDLRTMTPLEFNRVIRDIDTRLNAQNEELKSFVAARAKRQEQDRFANNLSFRITPELKAAVEAGQPLYSVGTAGALALGDDEDSTNTQLGILGALALGAATRGAKGQLPKAISKIALGGLGYGLSQSEDERLQGTGNALMGFAAYSLVHGKVKQGAKYTGSKIAEELAKSSAGRKTLDEISLDIRTDPRIKEVVEAVALRDRAKIEATGRELASEAQKRGPVFERVVSDILDKETVEAGTLSAEDTALAVAFAQKIADNTLGLQKVGAGLISADTYAKRGAEFLPRRYAKYEAGDVNDVVVQHKGKTFRIGGEKIRNDLLTREERDALGEIREVSYRIADYFGRGARDITTAHLFQALADIPGVINPEYVSAVREAAIGADLAKVARTPTRGSRGSPTAARDALLAANAAKARAKALSEQFRRPGQEYVTLPDTPQLGVLRGAVVRKDAADYLNDLPDFRSTVNNYDKLLKYWKTIKTVFNPSTHVSNFVANMPQAIMAGLPFQEFPIALPRAVKDIKEYGPTTRFLAEAGVLDRASPTYGDVPMKGVDQDKTVLRSMMKTTRPETRAALEAQGLKPMGTAEEMARKFGRGVGRLYSTGDAIFRVALFQKLTKNGMGQEEALAKVVEAFPGYDSRSPLIKKVKFLSPFVMYPVKYIPPLLDMIAENPWRWALVASTWAAVDQASRRKAGPVNEMDLPPNRRFSKAGYLLPGLIQGEALGLKSDQVGERKMIDIARFTPLTALTGSTSPGSPMSAVSENIPGIFQPSGPALDLAAMAKVNADPFSGRPFIKPGDEGLDILKKFTVGSVSGGRFTPGFAANLALPTVLSYQIPNVLKDLYYGNINDAKTDALGLVGLRPVTIKAGQQAQYALDARDRKIGDVNSTLDKDLKVAKDVLVRRKLINKAMEKRARINAGYVKSRQR